jgi:hypothetical protein
MRPAPWGSGIAVRRAPPAAAALQTAALLHQQTVGEEGRGAHAGRHASGGAGPAAACAGFGGMPLGLPEAARRAVTAAAPSAPTPGRARAQAARSRQGKMEKSLLSFAATYPTWEPDAAAKQLLAALAPPGGAGAAGAAPGPHFPYTSHVPDAASARLSPHLFLEPSRRAHEVALQWHKLCMWRAGRGAALRLMS